MDTTASYTVVGILLISWPFSHDADAQDLQLLGLQTGYFPLAQRLAEAGHRSQMWSS